MKPARSDAIAEFRELEKRIARLLDALREAREEKAAGERERARLRREAGELRTEVTRLREERTEVRERVAALLSTIGRLEKEEKIV